MGFIMLAVAAVELLLSLLTTRHNRYSIQELVMVV
jgi:hypothetical protein